MHELAFLALPALALPVNALRGWLARRRARRAGALAIGDVLPEWGVLADTEGRFWGRRDIASTPATVFVSMSNRCPGVKAYDARLATLAAKLGPRGVRVLGFNSVPDDLYPGESPRGMAAAVKDRGLTFPYLKDGGQVLMRLLGAVSTPQAFVIDRHGRLRYRGRIDDAFLEERVRIDSLADAVEDVLAERDVASPETFAVGCSIDSRPSRPVVAPGSTRAAVAA